LRVVAEGVEREELLNLLSGLQCDTVQGYLISTPRPAHELQMTSARAEQKR
jgi:EAL domain-containing protein (putative c-di-GMP-specific phosphodiesterase class I)